MKTSVAKRFDRRVMVALLLGVAATPALAQRNSLFNGNGRPAAPPPAAAPGGAPRDVVLVGQPAPAAAYADPRGNRPPPNPTLLLVSPIAVQAPPPRRFGVHDLITIIIREDKRSTSDATLDTQKKWTIESLFKRWFKLQSGNLVGQDLGSAEGEVAPGVGFAWDDKYKGTGTMDRVDSLITRITAEIIDVKPNGTLVMQATKNIRSDEEDQIVTLTGTCRSEDVTAQNTVLSTQIASLRIDATHSGAVRDASRRGWLMRAFDLLRPI